MAYNFIEEEKAIKKFWDKEKIYSFNGNSKKKIYSIDTPPPTVSGEMHLGHALMYSQMDFIARYKRMAGNNVFYPFGTDDNGLPTEKLIQKLKGVKSTEMPREEFIALCLKTLKEITPSFTQDWKNLGISCDYDISYSTIDEKSRKVSQKSFIELYKKGFIYKKEFPTIWDTEFQTPVAQAELEDKEVESIFYTLKFKSNNEELPIATTRPEMLGACVAIFVNPQDKRYIHLIGKKAIVPLFNHNVPIIAEKSAEIEKGTGAMMICSYGDKYDVNAIAKHKLIPKIILNKNGTLNIHPYTGLEIKKAREEILKNLKIANLLISEKKITHTVNVFEKSGKEIEFLPTEQWFIKILDKKRELLQKGKEINWYPKHMLKRYENWINGLEWDWSISRERHFGVPIPIWICENCKEVILAEESELPVDPVQKQKKCKKCDKIAKPETKVFDTWATSSLTPKIASEHAGNKISIPYSLRQQGHDIIRTWAFYTIARAYLSNKTIPWKNIAITGMVNLHGEKMAKSKGNFIRPQESIEKYGSDSLRLWAASSKLGEDIEYYEKDLIAGKKFFTKLINASNFVFMNLKDYKLKKPKELVETDKIFLKELDLLIKKTTNSFEDYSYFKSKMEIEQFFWKDFCDNYLEIIKWRVYNGNKQEKESALYTLYISLLTILKMLAPIIPFITEYIYQKHFKKIEKEKSIHLCEWPSSSSIKLSSKIWPLFLDIIAKIRQEKTLMKKPMNAECILTLKNRDFERIKDIMLEDLKHVANAKEIKTGEFKLEFM